MRVQWPSIFAGERQFVTDTFPPELDPVHFVAAEGELLISYASIIRMDLEHGGKTYKTYGFGNMLTFPSFRGQGYGTRVLELATDFIKRSDVNVAMLFCAENREPFYVKRGWEFTRSPTLIGTPNHHTTHDLSRMMLFVSQKSQQARRDFEEQPVYVDKPW